VSDRTLRIAFIGGNGHHNLRHVLDTTPGTTFEIAVASDGHDAGAAERFCESLRETPAGAAAQWFDDGQAMLDAFRPQLGSVGAVYGFNGDWNAQLLSRNIPTSSDKPVAATWPQLDRLKKLAAEDPSRVLLTEFDFRCRPAFRAARDAVAAGMIGEVALVTAQKSYRFGTRPAWYADREQYGGTLLWVASHGVDGVQFVTGRSIEKVSGTGGNLSRPELGTMEDHVAMVGSLQGGGSVIVHADYLRPAAAASHGDDRLRVVGGRGLIEIADDRAVLTTQTEPAVDITERAGDVPSLGQALFAAITGEPSADYSTTQSLRTAELLLRWRDATDGRTWL